MNEIRDQIKKKVDQLEGEAIQLLQEMIRINSENPPGNNPELANFLAGKVCALTNPDLVG